MLPVIAACWHESSQPTRGGRSRLFRIAAVTPGIDHRSGTLPAAPGIDLAEAGIAPRPSSAVPHHPLAHLQLRWRGGIVYL